MCSKKYARVGSIWVRFLERSSLTSWESDGETVAYARLVRASEEDILELAIDWLAKYGVRVRLFERLWVTSGSYLV